MAIPLEDGFNDILGKAQRGLQIADADLAESAGITLEDLACLKAGKVLLAPLQKLAKPLQLGGRALTDLANRNWAPRPVDIPGLVCFTTAYHDMMVNAYLAWDASSGQAAVFDTGADASPILDFIRDNRLTLASIFLTHTHVDHVFDLDRLMEKTGARAWVGSRESFQGPQAFDAGRSFTVGALTLATRLTWGHSMGGITYVLGGLKQPVAIVGDALFAGSMGGGKISYHDALKSNRAQILSLPDDTVLCPGHGPLTTVGEEKLHNPFFPEFQPDSP